MEGISSIGAGMPAMQFETEFQTKVAVMQKNAVDQQGELMLQLIQSAGVDPQVGAALNVQA